jgi:tRNA pseudouridine55 synthase
MPPNASHLLSGFLVVDKPAGWTSHDVVGRLRRLLSERRIGHAGTLDPAATGVLPVAVGQATRMIEFLEGATKSYIADVTFGVETDSYDADGTVTAVSTEPLPTDAAVAAVLERWVGPRMQVPPMFSAVKIGGRRLYESARKGIEVARPARQIELFALQLLDWAPPVATIFVDCSKGTYVRTLAHELGRELETGAYLSNLVRLRAGPYALCEAWTLEELAAVADEGRDVLEASWPWLAVHPDSAVGAEPAIICDVEAARSLREGRLVSQATGGRTRTLDSGQARAYDPAGHWLGVVKYDRALDAWRPLKLSI